MKNVNLLYIIVVILILLFKGNTQTFEVIPIYQYCINGTTFYAFLEEYKEDYLTLVMIFMIFALMEQRKLNIISFIQI